MHCLRRKSGVHVTANFVKSIYFQVQFVESADGDWCPFLALSHFGQQARCGMFDKDLPEVKVDGTPADDWTSSWLGRLPECKTAEGAT